LTSLDEGGGDRRTGWSGEFLELCTAGIDVEGGGCMDWEIFFSSHDGCRGAGKSSGCGKLLAFAEFSGELDHDKYGKLLLRLRGTEFAGKEYRVLGLARFDETTTDRLSAIPAWWRSIRSSFRRRLLAGQICLNSGLGFRPTLLMILNHRLVQRPTRIRTDDRTKPFNGRYGIADTT
jgi:hypothetical protein